MKLINTFSALDKNNNPYIIINYLDSKSKERTICLSHYDLEYALKGKIKYEISKKDKK